MDETMETGFEAEIDNAWNDVEAGEDIGADGPSTESAAQEPEDHQEPTEPVSDEPAPADQPELFTIKNRDEMRQVTRDELVAMAQKGWDYDKVREERDQLRQLRDEASPALELVKSYAQRNGMTVGDYLDYCRKQELIASGMTEQHATQALQIEKDRAVLNEQQRQIQAQQQQQNSALEQARKAQEARQKDFNDFLTKYPKVDPKSIPKEVWESVRNGESLVNAYTMHENARLQAELAAERQNAKNRATAPGSMGGSDMETQADLISRYWDEAD